jgi:hypothetical protein
LIVIGEVAACAPNTTHGSDKNPTTRKIGAKNRFCFCNEKMAPSLLKDEHPMKNLVLIQSRNKK